MVRIQPPLPTLHLESEVSHHSSYLDHRNRLPNGLSAPTVTSQVSNQRDVDGGCHRSGIAQNSHLQRPGKLGGPRVYHEIHLMG